MTRADSGWSAHWTSYTRTINGCQPSEELADPSLPVMWSI